MALTATQDKINELFDELVPSFGMADTVAGEIIRAISRISYRNYNDGDHIGVGYGKETCNPAARYLMRVTEDLGTDEIRDIILEMWGVYPEDKYDEILSRLEDAVLEFIEEHPELKTTENDMNMYECRTNEDVDDYDEEEEEWW